jgi:methylmalonyl-CoA mutase cobalamin-binding subunit
MNTADARNHWDSIGFQNKFYNVASCMGEKGTRTIVSGIIHFEDITMLKNLGVAAVFLVEMGFKDNSMFVMEAR